MTLSPECLIYWASGDFLSGVDTEIDTESHGELFFFDFYINILAKMNMIVV